MNESEKNLMRRHLVQLSLDLTGLVLAAETAIRRLDAMRKALDRQGRMYAFTVRHEDDTKERACRFVEGETFAEREQRAQEIAMSLQGEGVLAVEYGPEHE